MSNVLGSLYLFDADTLCVISYSPAIEESERVLTDP